MSNIYLVSGVKYNNFAYQLHFSSLFFANLGANGDRNPALWIEGRRRRRSEVAMIGFVTKVRLTSFFAGVATASFAGIYLLHQDYKACHDSIAQEVRCYS